MSGTGALRQFVPKAVRLGSRAAFVAKIDHDAPKPRCVVGGNNGGTMRILWAALSYFIICPTIFLIFYLLHVPS